MHDRLWGILRRASLAVLVRNRLFVNLPFQGCNLSSPATPCATATALDPFAVPSCFLVDRCCWFLACMTTVIPFTTPDDDSMHSYSSSQ